MSLPLFLTRFFPLCLINTSFLFVFKDEKQQKPNLSSPYVRTFHVFCFLLFFYHRKMMNGAIRSHDPSIGFYTGNGPVANSYPSTFTTNTHHINPPPPPVIVQPNTTRTSVPTNLHQQAIVTAATRTTAAAPNGNVYNFPNGTGEYYDQIHAQARANTPGGQRTSKTNLTQPSTSSTLKVPAEKTFLVVPGTNTNRISTPIQVNRSHRLTKDNYACFLSFFYLSLHHLPLLQSHHLIIVLHQINYTVTWIHHRNIYDIQSILSFNI